MPIDLGYRVPRKSKRIIFGLGALIRHGTPNVVIRYDGGIGDHLLCTVLCHELRRRGQKNLWMATCYPELFRHNRDIDAVIPEDRLTFRILKYLKSKIIFPNYTSWIPGREGDQFNPCGFHMIAGMAAKTGIIGSCTLKPVLHLTNQERKEGAIANNQITIQSVGKGGGSLKRNKEWYPDRFQEVVSALNQRFNFVQLGMSDDPLLDGVIDLRGKTSLRQSAAILSQSLVFVGLEGFLMHLARSVDCRSVIVYGGRTRPEDTGYSCNENLYTPLPCAPCWRWNTCEREINRECMDRITPDMVVAAIERQVAKYGTPLEVDTAWIPESGSLSSGNLAASAKEGC